MDESPELDGAIVSFVKLLVKQPALLTDFEQLSTGLAFIELLSQADSFHIDQNRIVPVDGWASALSNLKVLIRALEDYYGNNLKQTFDRDDIDLLKIAKFQDHQEIIKLFRSVMAVLTQTNNKQFFIQKIMSLEAEEQHVMATLIQTALSIRSPQQYNPQMMIKEKHELLCKLNELEQQISSLTLQNVELKEQRDRLDRLVQQQVKRVEYLEQQTSQLKMSSLDAKIEMISVIEKEQTNSLVENLKEKLISVSIEHEKEIIKYKQEIELMENSVSKAAQMEKFNEDYLDTIKELQSRLTDSAREREQLMKQLDDRTRLIESHLLNERTLNEKVKQLEYDKVNLRLESQKATLRSNELKHTISKITTPVEQASKVSRASKLSELCPEIDSSSYENHRQQLEKQIEILNNRNKQLERQLSKCKIKADKLDKLQDQKRKMEDVLLDYSNSRGEEIEILTTTLYELRMRYKNLLKKYEERENQIPQIDTNKLNDKAAHCA